jgi:hypothetical protein
MLETLLALTGVQWVGLANHERLRLAATRTEGDPDLFWLSQTLWQMDRRHQRTGILVTRLLHSLVAELILRERSASSFDAGIVYFCRRLIAELEA